MGGLGSALCWLRWVRPEQVPFPTVQASYANPSDEGAIFFSLGARKNDLVFDIALHLLNLAGTRFGNVDHQERDAPAILLAQLIEGRNLPPQRRSSGAAG